MSKTKISLLTAVLLCINAMAGVGSYINLTRLSIEVGQWGFLTYVAAALVLAPLVVSIALLSTRHPVTGGLYVYAQQYLPFPFGFLSGWSYFLARTTSATLLAHVVVLYFRRVVPLLASVPLVVFDYVMIFTIIGISVTGAIGRKRMQAGIVLLKVVPFLFAFVISVAFFDRANFGHSTTTFSSFIYSIPTALYSMTGFEVICAMGQFIENGSINIKRSIIIAFLTVIFVITMLQFFVFGAVGAALKVTTPPFIVLGSMLPSSTHWTGHVATGLFTVSILGSAMIMFSGNCWNLHTLVRRGYFPLPKFCSTVNKHNVAWFSLLVEALLGCMIITITTSLPALQNMTIFSMFISYGITSFAGYNSFMKEGDTSIIMLLSAVIAMVLCVIVMGLCLVNITTLGLSFSFLAIFFSGCFVALSTVFLKQRRD